MNKVNDMTYDEWFDALKGLIEQHNIYKKVNKNDKLLKQYWQDGEQPAVILRFLFPEYWRF